jgi:hypothetical protein
VGGATVRRAASCPTPIGASAPVVGAKDKAHRRVLFVDQATSLLDSVSGSAATSRGRPATGRTRDGRRESAVSFVRDNNLFLVPSTAARSSSHRCPPRRAIHARPTARNREGRRAEADRAHACRRKEEGRTRTRRALPKLESDRQAATDLQLSPDGTHVFVLIVERTELAKRTTGRTMSPSRATEDIPHGRSSARAGRTLAIMNLETGKTSQRMARRHGSPSRRRTARRSRAPSAGACRSYPDDGARAVAHVRADDNKDRWLVVVDPESGKSAPTRCMTTPGARVGFGPNDPSFGWQADQTHVWFLSERRWMHRTASTPPPIVRPPAADRREVGDRVGHLSPDKGSSTSPAPRSIQASGISTRWPWKVARAPS